MMAMRISFLLLFISALSGCVHHQLRSQLAHQSETVHHTFEKQVLNNLAMFTVKPDGLPFFMFPTEGASNVDGNASLSGSAPLNPFFETIGFESGRSSGNSWTLAPVVEEDKLRKIRGIFRLYLADGSEWLYCSKRRSDIPKCCTNFGEYCGTYVWVTPGCESRFADLVLEVIRAATVSEAKLTKVVTLFIDENGNPTTITGAVGTVVAEIDIDNDPIGSLTQDVKGNQKTVIPLKDYRFQSSPLPFNRLAPGNILQLRQELNTLGGSNFRRR
jgi:hypothetical protein